MSTAVEFPYITAIQQERQSFELPASQNSKLPTKAINLLKTGTTICGLKCKDCVILGTDTRSTKGPIVQEKNIQKLISLSDNIYCAGAGMVADLQHLTQSMNADLKLFAKQTGRLNRVQTCVSRLSQHLFKYQGNLVVAVIVAGVEPTGQLALFQVFPDGFTCNRPFVSMGSGSNFAMSLLEASYHPDLTEAEGIELVANAIESGILNDLGSGSNVDVVVIRKNDPTHPILTRNIRSPAEEDRHSVQPPIYPAGTTAIIKETRTPISSFRPYQNA